MQDEALFQGGELHCSDLSQISGICESLAATLAGAM
jgi:hypothetical protein